MVDGEGENLGRATIGPSMSLLHLPDAKDLLRCSSFRLSVLREPNRGLITLRSISPFESTGLALDTYSTVTRSLERIALARALMLFEFMSLSLSSSFRRFSFLDTLAQAVAHSSAPLQPSTTPAEGSQIRQKARPPRISRLSPRLAVAVGDQLGHLADSALDYNFPSSARCSRWTRSTRTPPRCLS